MGYGDERIVSIMGIYCIKAIRCSNEAIFNGIQEYSDLNLPYSIPFHVLNVDLYLLNLTAHPYILFPI